MTRRTCKLCGLNCGTHPLIQRIANEEHAFCCMGCQNVYLILSESGVLASGQEVRETEIFKRSLALGLIAQGEADPQEDPAPTVWVDSNTPTRELMVQVSGMWCTSCAWLIEHVVGKERGVVSVQASFASDTVKVVYCPQYLPSERVLEKIKGLGYGAHQYADEQDAPAAERRDLLLRMGVAAFLWANIMSLSLVVYASYFEPIAESVQHYLPFVLMALTTPVLLYCAAPIFRLAWRGLLHRAIRMEALLALGIASAYMYSAMQAFRGARHLYFDTVSVIVMLVLAGKLIERGAKDKATRWLTNLHRLTPNKVRLLAEGVERFVSVTALQPGTTFVIKVGERVAADGVVTEGNSHMDESLLTGESSPVSKEPGDTVVAGSVNLSSVLHVRALRTADESALARIIAQVEHALGTRSPVERAVDRVSRVFVPCVVVVAMVTFAGLWWTGLGTGTALMRAIAVLVIACPCALGLATPLAVTSAMGLASRHGVLISDSRVLETLQKLDVMVFDKTGTITEGRFSVLHQESLDVADGGSNEEEAIRLAGSLEQYSEHPLGKALMRFANDGTRGLADASEIEVRKGEGICGVVDGRRVFVGSRRLVESLHAEGAAAVSEAAARWENAGNTVAFYGWEGCARGIFVFGDRIRQETRVLVKELQQDGIEVQIVSGDSMATTEAVAQAIGADGYRAEVLPERKGEIVKELQERGLTVAMLGDGINDAPALAQADLGMAMGTGTDLAMKAAAVVLMDSRLGSIQFVLQLSRKTMRIIRQNLFWAFFYNSVGIVLAITGVLNPILAAAAMLLSSASVIGNTMRLSRGADTPQNSATIIEASSRSALSSAG